MRNRIRHPLVPTLALAIGLSAQVPTAQIYPQQAPEYGPATGTLVIVGGGSMDGTGIIERFIELGGGAEDGRFIIVPTAGGNYDGDGNVRVYDEDRVLRSWRARGLQNVSMLQTHDPAIADTEEFVAELEQATAVWFNGGRQWNIVDSYAGTRTYDEFHKVLERGGVVGGSSAGATILGEYLVRGDTRGSGIVMTDEENHQLGFEFLRKVAIDQHINTRNRWDHIIPVIKQKPHLLGIGLSEDTAIIVTGDTFEVMGSWMVAVHDNTRAYQPWEKPYFVLAPGDIYDMKARRIVEAQDGEKRAVIAAAQAIFDAMEALDPEAFRNSMVPDGFLMAVGFETTQRTTRDEFAARIADQTRSMIERIWNPEVRIDGPVATLWAPYDFYRGLEFSHCGTDAFQLAKTPDGWKVVMVSYTARMPPNCSTHPDGPAS